MNVKRFFRNAASLTAMLSVLTLIPSPAQAGIHSLASAQVVQSTMLWLNVASPCLLLSYDKNGNRTSQSVNTSTSGSAAWGAGTFGCFVWGE